MKFKLAFIVGLLSLIVSNAAAFSGHIYLSYWNTSTTASLPGEDANPTTVENPNARRRNDNFPGIVLSTNLYKFGKGPAFLGLGLGYQKLKYNDLIQNTPKEGEAKFAQFEMNLGPSASIPILIQLAVGYGKYNVEQGEIPSGEGPLLSMLFGVEFFKLSVFYKIAIYEYKKFDRSNTGFSNSSIGIGYHF